jgi:hypothetical protein
MGSENEETQVLRIMDVTYVGDYNPFFIGQDLILVWIKFVQRRISAKCL